MKTISWMSSWKPIPISITKNLGISSLIRISKSLTTKTTSNMKELKELITWFKEDPKDAIQSSLMAIAIFVFVYFLIYFAAIIDPPY